MQFKIATGILAEGQGPDAAVRETIHGIIVRRSGGHGKLCANDWDGMIAVKTLPTLKWNELRRRRLGQGSRKLRLWRVVIGIGRQECIDSVSDEQCRDRDAE